MVDEQDKIVVPADKSEISKKVKVDLEVDTSVKDLDPKPIRKNNSYGEGELMLGEYFQDCF